MLTVYSKPNCPDCITVKKLLSEADQTFIEKDITQDQEAFDQLMSLGLRQLPQVFEDDKLIGSLMSVKSYLDTLQEDFDI